MRYGPEVAGVGRTALFVRESYHTPKNRAGAVNYGSCAGVRTI